MRLFDFERPAFDVLFETDDGLRWRRQAEGDEVRLALERDADGAVVALAWSAADGGARRAVRADEYGWAQQEVRFRSGAVELCGLLMLPRAAGEHAGVVMIQGSGDSDRDNVWAFAIAHHLALAGHAVLLPDKRGCGKSGGDWKAVGFEELAGDALAGLEVLAGRLDVDAARIGLVGLSQGGWIAPLAAARDERVAFAVSVSSAATTVGAQVRHEIEMDVRAGGGDEQAVAIALELCDMSFEYGRTGAGLEDYLAGLDAAPAGLAGGFPRDPSDWRWEWYARIVDFDPVPLWSALERPALVVYGAEDERDNVPVAESVRRLEALRAGGRERLDVRVYAGSGHALGDPATGWIRRDFLDELARWIAAAGTR
jgi:pimeloyl-ACP methyl ester carboxylesterase